MELTIILSVWVLLAWGVGMWADARGRSGVSFGALSFFFSPILAGIILLIMSDKKAESVAENRRKMETHEEHQRRLEEIRALQKPTEAPAAPVPTAPPASLADELERIAKLRQEGSVTEEEFAALKRKLLGV